MLFIGKEKAFCILEFDKNNLWTRVQRSFWRKFSKQPPDRRTYKNGMRSLRKRNICVPQKRIAHHLQLKRLKKVVTPSSGVPESQSEDLVASFRYPQQPFGEG